MSGLYRQYFGHMNVGDLTSCSHPGVPSTAVYSQASSVAVM